MNEELRAVVIAFLACVRSDILKELVDLIEAERESRQ